MIQFLVTAVIVVIALFILALILCLMVWVITKLLRFLFPQSFHAKPKNEKNPKSEKKPKNAKKPKNHITGEPVEDRCDNCQAYGSCPMPFLVPGPCRQFKSKSEISE